FLALEVVVDDIRPDQIVRAHEVKRIRHLAALEVAPIGHLPLERRDLLLIGEYFEVAGIGEIDLAREEGGRCDPVIAISRHARERDRKKRPTDAVADGVDLALARYLLDYIERREWALVHIIFEGFLGEFRIRIDPRDHEDGQSLLDAPFDEGLLRRQIEYVELVDPWWHDQDRSLEHRC